MNLCRYGPKCFGCCGVEFEKKKEEIIEQVEVNTKELKNFEDLKKFRERHGPLFKDNGDPYKMCRNICKLKDGSVGCPLHPAVNNRKDFRGNYCYSSFMCSTVEEFKSWNERRQKKFLAFIDFKKLDTYDYSMMMDSDALLNEFKRKYR